MGMWHLVSPMHVFMCKQNTHITVFQVNDTILFCFSYFCSWERIYRFRVFAKCIITLKTNPIPGVLVFGCSLPTAEWSLNNWLLSVIKSYLTSYLITNCDLPRFWTRQTYLPILELPFHLWQIKKILRLNKWTLLSLILPQIFNFSIYIFFYNKIPRKPNSF